ncbi:MAG: alpha/beta hydrolase [Dehalococcoidia bacterium]|nr:alpha/beta hydrolase [Dehalococcoidia bacterium]
MGATVPQENWMQTREIRMHYLDWGPPSDGNESNLPLLALHGLASSCHWYDLVIPHLRDSYRCVALDQRGHGKTDQPSTGYDWNTLAGDIVSALDMLGLEKVNLCGHSWGGHVALSVAAKHPDRIAALALIDGGFQDWSMRPDATWESFKNRLRPRNVPPVKQDFLDGLKEQLSDCWSDELERIVLTMVRELPDGSIRDILEPSNHAQVMEAMWHNPPSTMFGLVQCPTIIIAAERRPGTGSPELAQSRRMMVDAAEAALEDSRVVWIKDSSHDIGYHTPVELAQTLDSFLAGR